MSAIPDRSPEQRAEALAKALATRQAKAQLRRDLKGRRITGSQVLDGAGNDPLWASLRVSWLLEALPGVGPVRAERVMSELGIAPSRRLQGLGERQRHALAARLAGGH